MFSGKRLILGVIIGILTLNLGACLGGIITKEDVVGVYKSNHPDADETLTINSNGTFVHVFVPIHGKGFEFRGSWWFYNSETSTRVVYQKFKFSPRSSIYSSARLSEWPAEVFWHFGNIQIPVNYDTGPGYYFLKRS